MKTYTKSEVEKLLKQQVNVCSVIPLLHKSRGRLDWREWNKFLTSMSKSIKQVKVKI